MATTKSTEMNIYQKLGAIQSELNAPKDKFNKFGNYAYRSAEGIMEALKPLLKKYGCVLTFEEALSTIADSLVITCTAVFRGFGEQELITTSTPIIVEKNKKGMTSEQVVGSALSYVRKYCLQGIFLIDDNKDPDTEEYHNQSEQAMPVQNSEELDAYLAELAECKTSTELKEWWSKIQKDIPADIKAEVYKQSKRKLALLVTDEKNNEIMNNQNQ